MSTLFNIHKHLKIEIKCFDKQTNYLIRFLNDADYTYIYGLIIIINTGVLFNSNAVTSIFIYMKGCENYKKIKEHYALARKKEIEAHNI